MVHCPQKTAMNANTCVHMYDCTVCAYIIHWFKVEVGFVNLRGGVEHEILPQLFVRSGKQLVEDVEVSLSLWSLSYPELLEEKRLKKRMR